MKLKGILIVGVIGTAIITSACSQKSPSATAGSSSGGALVMPAKYDINRAKTSSNKQVKRQMATTRSQTTTAKQTAKRRTATKKRVAKHSQPASSSSSPYITN